MTELLEPLFRYIACNTKLEPELLIEPVPYCFESLETFLFKDSRTIPVGTGRNRAAADQINFYYVDPKRIRIYPTAEWFDQLGVVERNHNLKHLDGALEPFIIEC